LAAHKIDFAQVRTIKAQILPFQSRGVKMKPINAKNNVDKLVIK